MVQPDLGRFAWTLVHRLSGELSHSGARLESRKLERMHVRLSDLAPHHLAAEAVRILAHRVAAVIVAQEGAYLGRDRFGAPERNQNAASVREEFGRVPVRC